jgi:6,7-dimethyl-8-ribityllumazine synthase
MERMATEISGKMDATGKRFGLVVARFNEFITSRLRDGAEDALLRHGAKSENLTIVHVPGAWEIPLAAKRLAESGRVDAIVCLGCVIRGQTPHFDYVAGQSANGVAALALQANIPIAFGIITADTLEQAIDRAGGKAGNKGVDAALSAIEMVSVIASIPRA